MIKHGKVFHVLLLQYNVILFYQREKVSFNILSIAYTLLNSTKLHHLFHYDPPKIPKKHFFRYKVRRNLVTLASLSVQGPPNEWAVTSCILMKEER